MGLLSLFGKKNAGSFKGNQFLDESAQPLSFGSVSLTYEDGSKNKILLDKDGLTDNGWPDLSLLQWDSLKVYDKSKKCVFSVSRKDYEKPTS